MQLSREQRKIHIDGLLNTRDLGGYETQSSTYTRMGRFIRSGNLADVSNEITNQLVDHGVDVVIDLRSDLEVSKQESVLINDENIIYYHIPLDQKVDQILDIEDIDHFSKLSLFYIYLLEHNKKQINKLFNLFNEHKYQKIVFHCLAGKDKTGIISGLLLDLAGCHEYDVVKDYSESYHNNQEMVEKLEVLDDPDLHTFLESSPHTMIQFMGYIKETYGSSKGYLLNCNVDENVIDEMIEDFTI